MHCNPFLGRQRQSLLCPQPRLEPGLWGACRRSARRLCALLALQGYARSSPSRHRHGHRREGYAALLRLREYRRPSCAGLNFPGYAQYEKEAVPGKTNVASWELPLWIVANFTTVDEAEAALKDVAVVDSPIVDEYPTSLLHWIVGDGKRSIAVEYTQDGMQIFTDDVDVLANQPGFGWHRESLRNYLNVTSDVPATQTWRAAALTPYGSGAGMRGIPGDYYSPSRFVRIAYLNANCPEQTTEEVNVSRMFHELASVAVIDGAARMTNGEFEKTVYTGGYSQRTHTYYWNTYDDPAIRSVSADELIAAHPGKDLIEAV